MEILVQLGTTFFTKSHYISQSQELLNFIPASTEEGVIIFQNNRYEIGISWKRNGKIKGVRLPHKEFKRFKRENPQINEHSNTTIRLNLELKSLGWPNILQSPDELIENSKLPLRSGVSEQEFYDIQERMKLIGSRGEESIVIFEKKALVNANRPDLAERVERVSKKDIGLGYDILSFDQFGCKKYIEVKTTTTNNDSFEFTRNEKKVCDNIRQCYYIYFIKNYKIDLDLNQELDLTIIPGKEFDEIIRLKTSCYTAKIDRLSLEKKIKNKILLI